MTHSELDAQFVQGLRLLHSPNKDSIDQLRTLLDEAIKQKHGLSKMLCNVLHKKYTMEEPVLSDHSSTSSKKSKSSSSSKHSSKSSKSDSPEEVMTRDTPPDMLASDDPLAQILEDDLTCVICKGMDVGARNRLVECADCHALYHQECHTPHIQDSQIDVPKLLWYCSNCIKAHQPTKDKVAPKSAESKKENKKSTSSSKHSDKYKGSTSHTVISTDSSPSSKLTPNINIITGDRRVKEASKKSKGDKRSGSTSSSGKYSGSSSSSKSSEKSSRKND